MSLAETLHKAKVKANGNQLYVTIKEDKGSTIITDKGVFNKKDILYEFDAPAKYFMENGGNLPENEKFDNSERICTFTKNSTQNEIRNIIRGSCKVTRGAAIQAVASYLRGSKESNKMAQRGEFDRKEELKRLSEYIDSNNLWIDIDLGQYAVGGGEEHQVNLLDGQNVTKLNFGIFYNSWLHYFYSLILHNYFFPKTSYRLIGFFRLDHLILAVVEQPFIRATRKTDLNDIKKFMSENGFVHVKGNEYEHTKLGIIVKDLRSPNVLTQDKILYFIDTNFYFKSDSYYKQGGDIQKLKSPLESRIPTTNNNTNMTQLEEKIQILEQALESSATSEEDKPAMRKNIDKFRKELTDFNNQQEAEKKMKGLIRESSDEKKFSLDIDPKLKKKMRNAIHEANIPYRSKSVDGIFRVFVSNQYQLDTVYKIYNEKRKKFGLDTIEKDEITDVIKKTSEKPYLRPEKQITGIKALIKADKKKVLVRPEKQISSIKQKLNEE